MERLERRSVVGGPNPEHELTVETITDAEFEQLCIDIQTVSPEHRKQEETAIDRLVATLAEEEFDEHCRQQHGVVGEIYKWRLHAEVDDELPLGLCYVRIPSRKEGAPPRIDIQYDPLLPYASHIDEDINKAISGFNELDDWYVPNRSQMLLEAMAGPDHLLHKLVEQHPIFDFVRSFDTQTPLDERPLTQREKQVRATIVEAQLREATGISRDEHLPYNAQSELGRQRYLLDQIMIRGQGIETLTASGAKDAQGASAIDRFRQYCISEMEKAMSSGKAIRAGGNVYVVVGKEANDLERKYKTLDEITMRWEQENLTSLRPIYYTPVFDTLIHVIQGKFKTNSPMLDHLCMRLLGGVVEECMTMLPHARKAKSLEQVIKDVLSRSTNDDWDAHEMFDDNVRTFSVDDDVRLLRARGKVTTEGVSPEQFIDQASGLYRGGTIASEQEFLDEKPRHSIECASHIEKEQLIGRMVLTYGPARLTGDMQRPDADIKIYHNSYHDTPSLIPGYTQTSVDEEGVTELVQAEADPYQYCSVEVPNVAQLIAWYRELGAIELADAVQIQEKITISQLADAIAETSDYPLADREENARKLLFYRSDTKQAVINAGRLELQCAEATTFLCASINLVFGRTLATELRGYVVGQTSGGELATGGIAHAQVLFVHDNQQYILDPTPSLAEEDTLRLIEARRRHNARGRDPFQLNYGSKGTNRSSAQDSVSGLLGRSRNSGRYRSSGKRLPILSSTELLEKLRSKRDKISDDYMHVPPSKAAKIVPKTPEEIRASLESQLIALVRAKNRQDLYRRLPRPRPAVYGRRMPQPDPVLRTLTAIRAVGRGEQGDKGVLRFIERYPQTQRRYKARGLRHYDDNVLNALSRALLDLEQSSDAIGQDLE